VRCDVDKKGIFRLEKSMKKLELMSAVSKFFYNVDISTWQESSALCWQRDKLPNLQSFQKQPQKLPKLEFASAYLLRKKNSYLLYFLD